MHKLALILVILFSSSAAISKNMVRIQTLGSSPKGQYIAFEEFGFKNGQKTPYSKIRVMNMWKNRYVTKPINVIGTLESDNLKTVRLRAKKLAQKHLDKFDINS